MKKKKYASYDRVHKYQYPSDVERGKIKKETTNYIKFNKKSKEISKKLANNIEHNIDDLLEDYEDILLAAKKEKKNAKVHKNRLKELSKKQEFY